MKFQEIRKTEKGFTLVELLAVIAVLGVVGSVIFGVLLTTLRGSNRSDSLAVVSQNGNVAMNQMVRMIQFAKKIEVPTTCYIDDTETSVATSSVTIRNYDDGLTEFSCANETLSSNSASLIDTNQVEISSCQFTCTQESTYDVPSIHILFTASKKGDGQLFENTASLPFETMVTPRNVQ